MPPRAGTRLDRQTIDVVPQVGGELFGIAIPEAGLFAEGLQDDCVQIALQ
jgi:hypothetical protein